MNCSVGLAFCWALPFGKFHDIHMLFGLLTLNDDLDQAVDEMFAMN